jgi:TetR/AcrR family transcriptional repressor of mexJK operon
MGPAPTASETRAHAKREQILEGARRVFLQEGFAGASTEEIAREARVSSRTLYAYFPSKEELFSAVLRALTLERSQMTMGAFAGDAEPRQLEELRGVLVQVGKRIVSTMMNPEYLALLRTMIADSHRFPELGELFRSTVPERGFKVLQSLLERAQANGVAIQGDPDILPRMFVGPLLTYALLDGLFRPDGPPRIPDAGKIEEIVDLYLRAIIPGEERNPEDADTSQRREG